MFFTTGSLDTSISISYVVTFLQVKDLSEHTVLYIIYVERYMINAGRTYLYDKQVLVILLVNIWALYQLRCLVTHNSTGKCFSLLITLARGKPRSPFQRQNLLRDSSSFLFVPNPQLRDRDPLMSFPGFSWSDLISLNLTKVQWWISSLFVIQVFHPPRSYLLRA